jgi:hypothetical protein
VFSRQFGNADDDADGDEFDNVMLGDDPDAVMADQPFGFTEEALKKAHR